jgi:outer membrane lipoprotein SlyB
MKQIITSNKTIIAAALLTLGLTGCASTQTLN